MRGPTGVKFCMMVSNRPYFIMPVQNFGVRTPKKFQGPKTCKIWPDFGRLRSSATNISKTDEDFQNRIFILPRLPWISLEPMKTATKSKWRWREGSFGRWTKKNLWNSVYNEESYRRSFWPTLSRIFRKTIFRPIGGAAPSNFYTR